MAVEPHSALKALISETPLKTANNFVKGAEETVFVFWLEVTVEAEGYQVKQTWSRFGGQAFRTRRVGGCVTVEHWGAEEAIAAFLKETEERRSSALEPVATYKVTVKGTASLEYRPLSRNVKTLQVNDSPPKELSVEGLISLV